MSTKRRSRYAGGVALVGYARVSTREQHPEGQTDALNAAGCEKVFIEHASGVLARRPVFDETLRYLREGDTRSDRRRSVSGFFHPERGIPPP